MPLIFSYGTLQRDDVQLATFGRRLDGERDALLRYAASQVKIEDPVAAARAGRTHHKNATFDDRAGSSMPGMVFDVTEAELAECDAYEAADAYVRVSATLASGRQAWVYVHAPGVLPRA
jgi:gamma-glutamylcyclotransferase (GGCT)/AIG2-like uncharacterized protein YtfP